MLKRIEKKGEDTIIYTGDLLPEIGESFEIVAEENPETGKWEYVVFKEHRDGALEMEEDGGL